MSKFFFGKKILITGASYGLGSVVAQELDKLGSHLILSARSDDKLLKILKSLKYHDNHEFIKCDLQSNISIKSMCDQIINKNNKIDIVMHIAGGGLGIKDPTPKYEDYINMFISRYFISYNINYYN